jgi:hypothetical protein
VLPRKIAARRIDSKDNRRRRCQCLTLAIVVAQSRRQTGNLSTAILQPRLSCRSRLRSSQQVRSHNVDESTGRDRYSEGRL